jgi:hypothetical protein
MDYKKIYTDLMSESKKRDSFLGYFENHHIIPKCLGGNNSPENLVKLTAREHFIAHLLLAKIYGGPLLVAVMIMTGRAKNSKEYKKIKELYSKEFSGSGNPFYGKKHSEKTIKHLSEKRKSRREMPRTDSWKQNISKGHIGKTSHRLGKTLSDEEKFREYKTRRGPKTKEHNAKNSISHLGKYVGFVWICNLNRTVRVHPSELPRYVTEGWKLGRKYAHTEIW